MQTRTRRRWSLAMVVAATWVLGHATPSDAQLFPNLPIQRPKVPCDQEAPYYKVFRQHYHGYFPTCWRAFPKGWACPCPNPEQPDWAGAIAKIPLQKDPQYFQDLTAPIGEEGLGPDGMEGPLPGREGEPIRPANPRSPFEMDEPNPRDRGPRPGAGASRSRPSSSVPSPSLSAIPDSLPLIGFPEATGPSRAPSRDGSSDTNRHDPTVGPTSVHLAPPPARRTWMSSLMNFGRR